MKVYINGVNYKNEFTEYDITYKNKYLYTTDGVYKYNEKDIKKIEYNDNTREKIYKGYTFLIDNSVLEYKDTIYHIPYLHLFCEETIYKKNIDGIYFVKVNYFDQNDYYFEVDNINDEICDKMITFLSSK